MPALVIAEHDHASIKGATLNTIVRNGMVASFVIYLGVAIVLQNMIGVAGLWIALVACVQRAGAVPRSSSPRAHTRAMSSCRSVVTARPAGCPLPSRGGSCIYATCPSAVCAPCGCCDALRSSREICI
jgi:hypothetical protein